MKRIVYGLMALLLGSLAVACDTGGEYVVQDDTVVYSYWTFSFGRINDTLPGADASTFRAVNDWLGCDKRQAYYEARPVPGVDVESIHPVRYPLFRDKSDYYYQAVALHVKDMGSFKILDWFERDFWAMDSQCAYYDSLRLDGADVASFKVLNMTTAKDKSHVYYFGKILPQADAATFEIIKNSVYSRDKSHIWCGDDMLQDADFATFAVDDMNRAHDKYGSFTWERRDTAAAE